MVTLSIDNSKFELPSKWNELTRDQLMQVARLRFSPISDKYFFAVLLKQIINSRKDFFKISSEAMPAIEKHLSFAANESKLTLQKVSYIRISWFRKLKGPADGLTDTTVEQFFEYAEPVFVKYATTGEEQWLNYLVASLYVRGSFSAKKVEKLASKMPSVKLETRNSVFLFFAGCRAFLQSKFPLVFTSDAEGEEHEPDGLEFSRLLNSISKGDPSKYSELRRLNLYEGLVHLQSEIEKGNELKEQLNQK